MSIDRLEMGLRVLHKTFRRILDDQAQHVIENAITQLQVSHQRYEQFRRRTDNPNLRVPDWGYTIYPENPLRFRPSATPRGIRPRIDIYCEARWREDPLRPTRNVIHMRLWSDEIDYCWREDWDSQTVFDKLTNDGRVLARWHFDLSNPEQQGPRHHLQFGGNQQANELCWLIEEVDLPRFPFPPMDLVLACQLVAATFFWQEYLGRREDPLWTGVVREAERTFLRPYYDHCLAAINSEGSSVLDALWNQ